MIPTITITSISTSPDISTEQTLGNASFDLSAIILSPSSRATTWLNLSDGTIAGISCLFETEVQEQVDSSALRTLESSLLHTIPSGMPLPNPKTITPSLRHDVQGYVHLSIYKYLSSRRSSISEASKPYIVVTTSDTLGAEGTEQIIRPKFVSVSGMDEVNMHFNDSSVLCVVTSSSSAVKIKLRDGDGVVAEGTILVGEKLAAGHAVKTYLPLRHGSCEKAGYVDLRYQFLPGGVAAEKRGDKSEAGPERVVFDSGNRSLKVKVETCRDLVCPGWPGRKEPFVEVSLVITGEARHETLATELAGSNASEGSAVWGEVLTFDIPKGLMSDAIDPSRELTKPRAILVVRVRGTSRLDGDGKPAIVGESTIPVPWSVLLRAKAQRRWHALKSDSAGRNEGNADIANPIGSSRRGEIRLTLSAGGLGTPDANPHMLQVDDIEALDSEEEIDVEEEESPSEKKAKKVAGPGPGLLIVQVSNLEVSRNREKIKLQPRSVSLSFNDATSHDLSLINAENIAPSLPSAITTPSPSKKHPTAKGLLANRPSTSRAYTFNSDPTWSSRPLCIPLPPVPPDSLNLKLSASHGISFYSNSMEIGE